MYSKDTTRATALFLKKRLATSKNANTDANPRAKRISLIVAYIKNLSLLPMANKNSFTGAKTTKLIAIYVHP